MNNTQKLVNLTLNRLNERLSEEKFPIEQYFDLPNSDNIAYFKIDYIDNSLSFILGVCKRNTDLMFSNFIFTGNINEVSSYINNEECNLKVLKQLDSLIDNAERHWNEV